MRRHRWRGKMGSGRGVGVPVLIFCALWMAVWAQGSRPGRVNIAYGLPSSSYTQSSNYDKYASSNGANGNTEGAYSYSNCIHTSDWTSDSRGGYVYDQRPWWQVDLGSFHYIYSIKIWGRSGELDRLYPFTITVDQQTCVEVGMQSRRDFAVNCTRPLYGRVVRLTRGHLDRDYYLNMCEFQIYECEPGYYGDHCNLQCLHGCSSDGCYMNDGKCISCNQRVWGDHCQSSCGHCAGNICHRSTGACTECQPGWYEDQCLTRCPSPNCLDEQCHQRSGLCVSCKDNFTGSNCTECSRGMFGEGCQHPCSSKTAGCQACERDGHCTDCSGNFKAPDCTVCSEGYYKKDNGRCGICSIYCVSRSCDPEIGKCNECPERRHGDQCTQDCPQGCKKCEQDGGQCTECYQNRKPPDCNECLDGYYNRYSSIQSCLKCRGTCLNGTICDKTTGHCPACPPGKKGHTCQSDCQDGWYGVNCTQRCGVCHNGVACNKTNGHCPCPLGKQPPRCDTDCQNNTYGKDCQEKCGHCSGGSACDPTTGHCAQGCQPGWIDPTGVQVHLCKTECLTYRYGPDCQYRCGQCLDNEVCDISTGYCPGSCVDGFLGPRCDSQASKSGPEFWLVVGLLAIVIAFVCRTRRKTRRSRTEKRTSYNMQHDEHELSSKEASQPARRLFVQPAEEEGLYTEVDCPALPSHAPPAVTPLAKVEGAGCSKQKAPESKRNTPEEMSANTDPNVLTSVNVGREQTSSEATPARRRGNDLTKSSKQQSAGAEGEVAKPAQEIREQTASGTKQAFFPPTVGHNLKSDSASSFPSPDLTSVFASNPKEHLDAESPYEEVAETPTGYEQPTLYMNTTEDSHMYDELQSGTNDLYENNGNKGCRT